MATKPVNNTNLNNPLLAPKSNAKKTDATAAALAVDGLVAPPEAQAKTKGNFDVQISPDAAVRAAEKKKAYEIAKATPDVDEAKVKDLRERIANGTYKVDSERIADGMMKEAILDHLSQLEDR